MKLADSLTTVYKRGDSAIEEVLSFKFGGFTMKYHTIKDTSVFPEYVGASYFEINGKAIPIDSTHPYADFAFEEVAKVNLNGTTYLLLVGYSKNCIGSFCRAQFDHLIQIKDSTVHFQIIDDMQYHPNIYCDLNNDGQLDQINFSGDCAKNIVKKIAEQENKYYFCAQALTLKNERWEAITDKKNKPYYIYFQVNDIIEFDKFKILEYIWPWEL